MASEFFGRQCECRFYTVGCGNEMAVSVTGPRAVNELGSPVIHGGDLYGRLAEINEMENQYWQFMRGGGW